MTEKPDNFDRAMKLLRRQRYDEVADYVEKADNLYRLYRLQGSLYGAHPTIVPSSPEEDSPESPSPSRDGERET